MVRAVKGMEREANLEKMDMFVDINVGDWEGSNLRERATAIGLQDLHTVFGSMSDDVHASWVNVRMNDLALCMNPTHGGHYIPYRCPDRAVRTGLSLPVILVDDLLGTIEEAWCEEE